MHIDLESITRQPSYKIMHNVRPRVSAKCQLALTTSHPFTGNQVERYEQRSSNKSRRVYHASYRFKIFCNLFRKRKSPPNDESLSDALLEDEDSTCELDAMEKASRLLSLFNPWEVEELACVVDCLSSYYRPMLV